MTAANIADCSVLPELLHGEETKVWGDQAYRGQSEAIREAAPMAQDMTNKRYRYKDRIDEVQRAKNRNKSRVRSKVEHVFAVIKLKFGYVKVRYRGIKKNANQVFALCALSNLFLCARDCCAPKRRSVSGYAQRHSQNTDQPLETCTTTPENPPLR